MSQTDLSGYTHPRSLRYLILRAAWFVVELLVYPRRFRRLMKLRIAILRLFGARIGQSCFIGDRVRIWVPWNLSMADWSVLGDQCEVYNLAPVSLGTNAIVSQYAYLCTATHDHTHPYFPLTQHPITIGNGAWIASKAFVGPGITIGDGAVVGAMSVVVKDVPPSMIYAGNPARPIKPRVVRSVDSLTAQNPAS